MANFPPNVGYVFTSEMANQAVHDVQQGKQPTVAHWHSAYQHANSQFIPPNMPKSARNSPSYQNVTTSGNRKRKGSQITETLNDNWIKTDGSHQNTECLNPIKSLEQMAIHSEFPTKSSKPDLENQSREEKLAKLAHLSNQLNLSAPQPPPPGYNYRYAGPQMIPGPSGMYYPPPPNGPEMFHQSNFSAPQPPPPGYNYRYPGPQMIPRPNGMYYPPQPNGPEMFHQWPQDGPQSLANLDSRVPSQKINYYSNKTSLYNQAPDPQQPFFHFSG
ncbi:hypothetical protein M3Y96_00727900 [Aphelenchoides besseyi]|nr:hypothetical protein M3Y96_00727900 [Aphelenchoides besseyi]